MGHVIELSLAGLSVMIGMPTTRDLPPRTAKSLVATVAKCLKLDIPCEVALIEGCGVITKARDDVLAEFLASSCNRLFWIDSDMVWTPGQFIRLLALSTRVSVVGATYPAKMEPPAYLFNFDAEGVNVNDLGLLDVKGMGLGFTVVRREPLEQLAAEAPRMRDQISGAETASVFRTDIFEGDFRTEDMAFFADLREAGHTVWVDPTIDLGHIGAKEYRSSVAQALVNTGVKCVT